MNKAGCGPPCSGPDAVVRTSVRFTGGGAATLEGEISITGGRARSVQLLPILHQLSDAVGGAAGRDISCQAACAACCRLLVVVSDTEARAIAELVARLPGPRQARVRSRFQVARRRLAAIGPASGWPEMQSLEPGIRTALAERYFAQRIDCPFLEDECCSVYPERPLACREHRVSSPPQACSNPDLKGIEQVPPAWSSADALDALGEGPSGAHWVPLVAALDWVAAHPEQPAAHTGVELLRAVVERAPGGQLELLTNGLHKEEKRQAVHERSQRVLAAALPATYERCLVPDYERPDALMVPHGGPGSAQVLEDLAMLAAQSIGVILLSSDPRASEAFANRQPDPGRFRIVAAALDTGWIRDRAPFAVQTGAGVDWVLPRVPGEDRPADALLFERISARPLVPMTRFLSGGNLVAGPGGLALSTQQVLAENDCVDPDALRDLAKLLGIRRWLFFPPFREELSGHADVHVRFLGPELFAVAWSRSCDEDRVIAQEIEFAVRGVHPGARCIRIPMRSEGSHYASLVNWVQVERELLLPRYPMTPQEDLEEARQLLAEAGFRASFVNSPTEEFAGSLHCLSASIYAGLEV